MNELYNLTIHEASKRLKKREISSLDLTQSCLQRIEEVEPSLKAFVTITSELAIKQANDVDQNHDFDIDMPLAGIPVQIKDVLCTSGIPTTCSSRMLENFVPPYDATVTENLYSQKAVLVGKGNMDEFAMGSSTENSAFYPTHNPWDITKVPGGSSGGSAAAVASGEAIYSLGSDTGGSIRQPASFCGIVALKPTYGLVSRYGLVAFASSLDQIGPMTKDVEDASIVLTAIAGYDTRDSTSLNSDIPDYSKALTGDVKGLRVGIPKEYFVEGTQQDVRNSLNKAISVMEDLGVIFEEVSLPSTEYALACYYIIAPSECSANLARYDGVKYGYSDGSSSSMWEDMERTRGIGFGPEVKRRVMLGTYSLSSGYYEAYYLKAQKVRSLIRKELSEVFQRFDALVAPTSPTVAFQLGEKTKDPVEMYLSDICTIPANIAGIPAISLPCGFSGGLPIGMQLMGPVLSEFTLIRLAYAYEQLAGWHTRRPPL